MSGADADRLKPWSWRFDRVGEGSGSVNIASRLMGLMGLGFAAFLALTPLSLAPVYAGSNGGRLGGATDFGRDIAFHVTDDLSAQTQATLFPRPDVAFSLTHHLWADAPGEERAAGRQELAWLRLSQPLDMSGQQQHAFSRLTPTSLWADLLLEARVAPFSGLHLSTSAAYDPTEAHVAWTTAELWLQPLSFWTLSLSPEFRDTSHLERVTGRMQFTLSDAWSVSYAIGSQTLDPPAASHTVTTRYRSPYGNVRLQLAQSPKETTVGVLIDVVTFLRRTLGF
jgi:hypothetical protein